MTAMKSKCRPIMVLLALCALMSGCWDHHPPENSAFIIMLGLDTEPDDPQHTVVTQLAVIPSALAAGEQSGQSQGTPFYLLSNAAATLESAQLTVFDHLSRVPRLEHLTGIVFGHEFARAGRSTAPAISWALRHPQIRPGAFLFVTDDSAQQFLDARPALDPLPGAAIVGLMRHSDRLPFVYPVRVYEFARTLLSPRMDGAIPLVGRANPLSARVPVEFEQQPFVGASSGDGDEPMDTQIQLLGMAVFKGSRMVGTLTADDGSGLTWIAGSSKSFLSVPHPEHPDDFVVAVAVKHDTKRRARLDGDKLILSIETTVIMDLWGEGSFQPVALGKHLPDINEALVASVEEHIKRTMKRLQDLRVDIFGFGEELYRASPKDWDKVAHVWDEVYADATLDIRVDVTVRRTGLSR